MKYYFVIQEQPTIGIEVNKRRLRIFNDDIRHYSLQIGVMFLFKQDHWAVHYVRVLGVTCTAWFLLGHLHQDHVRRSAQCRQGAATLP